MAPKRTASGTAPTAKRHKAQQELDLSTSLANLTPEQTASSPSKPNKKAKTGNAKTKESTAVTQKATSWFVLPYKERPRFVQDKHEMVEECILGYRNGENESDLQGGVTQPRQSKEIQTLVKRYQGEIEIPIAKDQRNGFVWVAEAAPQGMYTVNVDQMVPIEERHFADSTCDICGANCTEVLHVFRCYRRRREGEASTGAARKLHPFVAYISLECGRGLLSSPSSLAKLREQVYTTFLRDGDSADAFRQMMKTLPKEHRQAITEELRFYAGSMEGESQRKTELRQAETTYGALQHGASDPFRGVASTLSSGAGAGGSFARTLAMTTLFNAECCNIDIKNKSFLESVKVALEAGLPLPQAPVPLDFEDVKDCLELLHLAWPMIEIELQHTLQGQTVYQKHGPSEIKSRLFYLPGCSELHAPLTLGDADTVKAQERAGLVNTIKGQAEELIKDAREYFAQGSDRKMVVSRNVSKAQDRNIAVPEQEQLVKLDDLKNVLETISWPCCFSRPNVKPEDAPYIEAFPIGMVLNYCQGLCLSHTLSLWPNLTQLLTRLIRQEKPDFRYTTIQLNRDYAAKMHVDGNNHGPSYIIALGDFTGGDLWIMDKDGDKEMEVPAPMRGYPELKAKDKVKGRLWDAKNKWVKFNGNVPHQAMPFKGSRISLVFFSRKGFERLKDDTRSQLENFGFPIPPASEATKTETMEVIVEEIGDSAGAGEEVKFADLAEEEIDEDEEVDQFMQGEEDSTAWNARNWAQDIQQLLGVDWQKPGRFKSVPKLQLFVCNIGSGAPACALREILPERLSEVYAMSHVSKQLARFGRRNFKPGHMFESEEGVSKGAGTCFTHRTCCNAPPSEEDVFVGSFSTLPFLGGKDRLKRSFMEDRRSALFVHMRKHLEVRKPKVAVLEATDFAAVPATQRIPLLSILLDGKDKSGMDVGLRTLKDYTVEVIDMDLRRLGLPVAETRVHFVLVLKEAGGEVVADKISDILRRIQEDVVPRCSLNELLFKRDDRRLKQVMQDEWLPKKKDGQQRLGEGIMLRGVTAKLKELRRNPPAAGARLYCDMKDSEVDKRFPHATEQQRMHLNVAYEHAKQTGLDVDRLVVDLSQPMASAAWRDDGLLPGRLTLGAEEGARVLYSFEEKRILTAQEELLCYGFPVWRLSLQGLSDQQVGHLGETAMAVTCIGATLSAVLALANLGKERAELRASEYEITNLIAKMSSRRTGLAATALEVLASQANAGTEQGGSEVEVRAATLLSLLRHDLTGDSNEGSGQAKEAAEEVKKTLQKLEGLEESKDSNQDSGEIDIHSLPVMTSTTGQQEPMDFEARRKKIMHVPDTWPWEVLLRWTAEAAEDPFAPEALQIMMHGTKQLRLRIQRKQAVSDRQLHSTDIVIGLLRASDRIDLADELEAVAMAEMYARMDADKSTAQGTQMDPIRYIEGLINRCKRSGWRPRHWLLNHVADIAHKAGKEEVMKCFDECQGWKEMVAWLHNVPKDPKAWVESEKSLGIFAKEAEHRVYLLAPVFAAADRLDQAAVAKKCLEMIVEITTGALTEKVDNPVAEGIKRLHGEVGNVFTDSQRAVQKARDFATMPLVGMREEELKKLLKQAQGLDAAKEPLRQKDEFAPLLDLLEKEVSHALKTIANAMQARMNSVKDAQNKKEAKLLEDELQKHLTSSGQLINVDDVHSFAQKMQRFAQARKNQSTPKQEELANRLSKAVTEHCELPARRQAAERLLRSRGLGSVVPLLREKGLLETLPTLKAADLPKALVGPLLDMLKEFLDGNEKPREEDLAPPATLPPGWQGRISSRFGLMIYSNDPEWRTAQFERPVEMLAEDQDINIYAIPPPELAEEENCKPAGVAYMVIDSLGNPFCMLCRRGGKQHFDEKLDQGHAAARRSWQTLLSTLQGWHQALSLEELEKEKAVPRLGAIWRVGLLRFFQTSKVVSSVRNNFWWQVVQERLPHRDASLLDVREALSSMIMLADKPEKLEKLPAGQPLQDVRETAMSMCIDKGYLESEDAVGQRHAISAVIQLRQMLHELQSTTSQPQLDLLATGQNALRRYAERSARCQLAEEWLLKHPKIMNAKAVVQHLKDKEFLHRLHQVAKRPDLAAGLPPKVVNILREEIAAGDISEAHFLPPVPHTSKWKRVMSRKLGLVYFQSVEDPNQTQWAIPVSAAIPGSQLNAPVSSSDSGEESA